MTKSAAVKLHSAAPIIMTADRDSRVSEDIEALTEETWPAYILYGRPPVESEVYADWFAIYECLPSYQFAVYDADSGQILASGNSAPIAWNDSEKDLPDTGWDWALRRGLDDFKNGSSVNCLVPLSITVRRDVQHRGLSKLCLHEMQNIALKHGFRRTLAPVRPTLKSLHQEVDIAEYASWKSIDGRIFDPWFRAHLACGGRFVKPCRQSMTFVAGLEDWRNWTGHELSENGPHQLPDFLAPLEVDLKNNIATYIEPNYWVEHKF